MRRTFSIPAVGFVAAVLCLCLVGCARVSPGNTNGPGIQPTTAKRTSVSPVVVGTLDGEVESLSIAVHGGHAYVADMDRGFLIVDVRTPSTPVLAGELALSGYAVDVATSRDGYVYVTALDYGPDEGALSVVDVREPKAAAIVGSVATPDVMYLGNAVVDRYVYVAAQGEQWSGLHVIDIHDPRKPQIISTLQMPGRAYTVATSGSYVYVTMNTSVSDDAPAFLGLVVVDATNPRDPKEVGRLAIPGGAASVAAKEGFLYTIGLPPSDEEEILVLHAVDVRSPSRPSIVSSTPLHGGGYGVVATEGWICASGVAAGPTSPDQAGLSVFDVRDPADPSLVGTLLLDDAVMGMAGEGRHLYVVQENDVFRIVQLKAAE